MTTKQFIDRNMEELVVIVIFISIATTILTATYIVYSHDTQMAELGYIEQPQLGTSDTIWVKPKDK